MLTPLLTASLLLAPPAADPPKLPEGVRAYDSFEKVRPGQYLVGSKGGDGWLGPWVPEPLLANSPYPSRHPRRADHLLGMADSLRLPGVVSAGGSVSSVALDPHLGAVSRRLAHPVGLPGTTTYIGVLIKPEGRLHAGSLDGCFGLILNWRPLPTPGNEVNYKQHHWKTRTHEIAVGKPWTDTEQNPKPISRTREWCLFQLESLFKPLRAAGRPLNVGPGPLSLSMGGGHAYLGDQVTTGEAPVPGATTLLVLRVEVSRDGTEAVCSAFVDPDPTRPEPAPEAAVLTRGGLAVNASVSGSVGGPGFPVCITLFSSGAVTFDELRVADTLAGAAGIANAK
ncbi:hypothetical protein [Alienimonas sp. DA493]|uniref:hypothetical protein n=1 Tax=Alienimonas sp. DA493 TaxID=3373605 RepID=UPI0037546FA4